MRIVQTSVPSSQYFGPMDQGLDINDMKNGFAKSSLSGKTQLWSTLRDFLNSQSVNQNNISGSNGILLEGNEITSLVLNEALDYFYRALYNFYAQDKLIEYGYATWSHITNYYSNYFSVQALLRVQGRSLTRIWRTPKADRIVGQVYYIFPYDFASHKYIICTNYQTTGSHYPAWHIYYLIYKNFNFIPNEFEKIFKRMYVGSEYEEVEFRVQQNYEPWEGFNEIWNPKEIPNLIANYEKLSECEEKKEIETLSRLTTDPGYRFYARGILRILFCQRILKEICTVNSQLSSYLTRRKSEVMEFIRNVTPRNIEGIVISRVPSLMDLI